MEDQPNMADIESVALIQACGGGEEDVKESRGGGGIGTKSSTYLKSMLVS